MLLDGATAKANKDRFVRRAVENEAVYFLSYEGGVANSISNEHESSTVLMFWSDAAYAKRVQSNGFDEYDIQEISLFDFLYRWLPGMSGDHMIAGVNWNRDLVGLEVDPYQLRTELEESMPASLLDSYSAEYEEHTGNV